MDKMQILQQALENSLGKAPIVTKPEESAAKLIKKEKNTEKQEKAEKPKKRKSTKAINTSPAEKKPAPPAKAPSRVGKEYTGAWLNPDFGMSLRLVQIKRRRDDQGKKIYLDDLIAEALNDLFRKYDVPTVQHQ